MAALREGVDPLAERDGGRDAVTVKDLAARFDAEHIAVHLKPSMRKEYRRSLKKFILPFFGSRPIAEVSRGEVARFHHKYRRVLPSAIAAVMLLILTGCRLGEIMTLK